MEGAAKGVDDLVHPCLSGLPRLPEHGRAVRVPELAVERDLDAGHAAVIQIVSTGEALMERRLAEIPTEDWGDVQVDITPREYVLDYLAHSFPTQLYEPFTDGEGNLSSRPVFRDGQPVLCREAVARRSIRRLSRIAKGRKTRCSKRARARIAKGGGLIARRSKTAHDPEGMEWWISKHPNRRLSREWRSARSIAQPTSRVR